MNKTAGVYKITNNISGKIYIGESENIDRRWKEHLTDFENNNHCNKQLQTDFNNYGKDSFTFEVIESIKISDTENESVSNIKLKMMLICRESIFIKKYNTIKSGYNIIDTLQETLENKFDIFQRNKIQDDKIQKIIKYFMKNNPQLLDENHCIELHDIIPHSTHDDYKNGHPLIRTLYYDFQAQDLLPNCISESIFRNILYKNNLIYNENYSWHATQYALDNELIVLGKSTRNSYGFWRSALLVTNKGIDKIRDILELRKFNIEIDLL